MEWNFTELKNVVDIRSGSINPSNYPNEKFEVYSIPACDLGSPEILLGSDIKSNKSVVKPNDILFSKLNPRIPRVFIVNDNSGLRQISSTEFWALSINPKVINKYFLRYLLLYPSFRERFVTNTEAATKSRSRLKPFQLLSQQIPLPPMSEQRRIVEILDQADALRKQRIHANKVCDRILPDLFLKMFGDPATNPMGWDVVYVKDLFAKKRSGVKCGPFGSALKRDEYVNTGIPVWGIDNVKKNEFIESGSLFITEDKYKELTNYSVESGDILISRAGTVGRMCVAKPQQHPSIIGTNLIRLSLDKNKIIPDYFSCLCSYFSENINQLRASSDKNSYSFMNTNSIKSLQIPLPPIDLQKKYYNFLSTVVTIKNQSSNSENKLEKLFNILLHRAFSGELTAKWREGHLKELLAEMEHQSKVLNLQTELF
jgi:type I restriction enzyme, S subunit